ncbi:MAG: hypothetical protein KBD62_38005 [Kofleriaceae bacterium]|nr:hypothetical protein [Kofleriaceae bacterium]
MGDRPRYVAILHDGVVEVHAYAVDPSALCGLAGDGDDDGGTVVELPERARITCQDCLHLWRSWQRFTKRDFAAAYHRTGANRDR